MKTQVSKQYWTCWKGRALSVPEQKVTLYLCWQVMRKEEQMSIKVGAADLNNTSLHNSPVESLPSFHADNGVSLDVPGWKLQTPAMSRT